MKLPDIWMQCGGKSNLKTIHFTAWRIVEAQHVTSTRKLVDSEEEHRILEEQIDRIKPSLEKSFPSKNFHFLLFTPFRYPPLFHGSRFGTRQERSLWYGSQELKTAQAEVAYYRFLFLSGSSAHFENIEIKLTAFTTSIHTKFGIDLSISPFSKFEEQISSKTSYIISQKLGNQMRQDGVEAFCYISARDIRRRKNIALFHLSAFSSKEPLLSQTWSCIASTTQVEFIRSDLLVNEHHVFTRSEFEVSGQLPSPAL